MKDKLNINNFGEVYGKGTIEGAVDSLVDRLINAEREAYKSEYQQEILDLGVQKIDEEYQGFIQGEQIKIENTVAELRKIYERKMKTDGASALLANERNRRKYELMSDEELLKVMGSIHEGPSQIYDPDELDEISLAIKRRLPKNYQTFRARLNEIRYMEPWRRLIDDKTKKAEIALKSRKSGEIYTYIESQQNPGVSLFMPHKIKDYVAQRVEERKLKNHSKEMERRVAEQFKKHEGR